MRAGLWRRRSGGGPAPYRHRVTERRLPHTHRELLELLPDWGSTARDRRKTMRLISARDASTAAHTCVAVREAHDAGDSWLTIGTILGISRQAAQQRFRRLPEASLDDQD